MLTLYGGGGLEEVPTPIESAMVAGCVGDQAKAETLATHTSTTVDGITPVLTAADVGKEIFAADIPVGTTIVAIAPGGASATLSQAATATAAAHAAVVFPSVGMAGCKVMLFTDVLTPPFKALVVGDLTPATYDGYAISSAVTWSAPLIDVPGNVFATGDKKQFLCTGSTANEPITGAALISPDGVTLLQVDMFKDADGAPMSIGLEANGQGFDYVPLFSFAAQR